MRLKDVSRKPKEREAYIHQDGLLLIGVDVSKNSHSVCIGSCEKIMVHRFEISHNREGFHKIEQTIRKLLIKYNYKKAFIAMEPSGIYWISLYKRLQACGFDVCLVHCSSVSNNRKTLPGGRSKTDSKDAHSIYDLLRQGKFFLPVRRDADLEDAYRLMKRYLSKKNEITRIRNQLRQAIHLYFPELNEQIRDLTLPTSLRFLQSNPTPRSIRYNGRKRFLEKWRPRKKCGQWPESKFRKIYHLAGNSVGVSSPNRADEFEIRTLAGDLSDALAKANKWREEAIRLLEDRSDYQLLMTIPRIGKATAAAILVSIGDIDEYNCGKQLVKLAGLDLRLWESGSSVYKYPKVSGTGNAFLRYWLHHYAKRLVAFEENFKKLHQRRKEKSPGKGAGSRALIASCD